ncbi:MAG: FliG C-terminal domain-containing protein [Pirellulales bacterium]
MRRQFKGESVVQEEAIKTRTSESMLRKVALVVAGLAPDDAESLLAQLPQEAVQQVRDAVEQLDAIDPAEQESAIADFLGGWNGVAWRTPARDDASPSLASSDLAPVEFTTANRRSLDDSNGVELDDSLARQFADRTAAVSHVGRSTTEESLTTRVSLESEPFDVWSRLRSVSGRALGRCLARENPQTIAVVLAQLPPQQAAESIAELNGDSQTEVLRRLAQVHTPDPELLDEIGAAIIARLALLSHENGAQPAGRAALAAILSAAPPQDRDRWSRQAGIPSPAVNNPQRHAGTSALKPMSPAAAAIPASRVRRGEPQPPHTGPAAGSGLATSSILASGGRDADILAATEDDPLHSTLPPHLESKSSHSTHRRISFEKTAPRRVDPARIAADHRISMSSGTSAARDQEQSEGSESTPINGGEPLSSLKSLEDLLSWSDHDLAKLVAAVDPWVFVLAIAGAAPQVASGWFSRLPNLAARELRGRLHQLGPWRLDDAVEAERRLIATARKLLNP